MFNHITLVGNATQDPELKYSPSGTAIAKFNIACNEYYNDKNTGEKREDTLFIEINCFGKTAEMAHQYVKRGMRVLVDGKLGFDQWVDGNGHKRSRHFVKANKVVFLQCKSGSNNEGQAQQQPHYQQPQQQTQAQQQPRYDKNMYEEAKKNADDLPNDEEIPF